MKKNLTNSLLLISLFYTTPASALLNEIIDTGIKISLKSAAAIHLIVASIEISKVVTNIFGNYGKLYPLNLSNPIDYLDFLEERILLVSKFKDQADTFDLYAFEEELATYYDELIIKNGFKALLHELCLNRMRPRQALVLLKIEITQHLKQLRCFLRKNGYCGHQQQLVTRVSKTRKTLEALRENLESLPEYQSQSHVFAQKLFSKTITNLGTCLASAFFYKVLIDLSLGNDPLESFGI